MTELIEIHEDMLSEILAIEDACFSPPWSEGSFIRETDIPDARFAAVRIDGNIAGYCVSHMSGDDCELYKIATAHDFRRQGVALTLMEDALRFARSMGAERMLLEVRAGNAPAIALYERCGFGRAGVRKNYYTDPVENAVVMVKESITEGALK